VFTVLQINRRASISNAAYNFPGTHCSYSATGIRNWATQQTWLDCFFWFVSLAVQRLPKIFYSHISSAAFSTAALHQRPINTQHCIYMSLQKLITTVKLCTACIFNYSQLSFWRQRPSTDHRWSGWPLYNQKKNTCPASALFHCSLVQSDAAGHKTTQRRRRPPVRRRTALIQTFMPLT